MLNKQSSRTLAELNKELLMAHEQATDDVSNTGYLVDLYCEAYELTLINNASAAYFYLTNAYVYALDTNHSQCDAIESLLKDAGRL